MSFHPSQGRSAALHQARVDAARHLYESCGFVLVEERRGTQWGTEVMEQRYIRRRPKGRDGWLA